MPYWLLCWLSCCPAGALDQSAAARYAPSGSAVSPYAASAPPTVVEQDAPDRVLPACVRSALEPPVWELSAWVLLFWAPPVWTLLVWLLCWLPCCSSGALDQSAADVLCAASPLNTLSSV